MENMDFSTTGNISTATLKGCYSVSTGENAYIKHADIAEDFGQNNYDNKAASEGYWSKRLVSSSINSTIV